MQKGAEIDPRNRLGRTPLDFASNRGHVAVMERLLEEGARIEAADKFGVTALMAACRMGNLESAKCLLRRGADILARSKWYSTPRCFLVFTSIWRFRHVANSAILKEYQP